MPVLARFSPRLVLLLALALAAVPSRGQGPETSVSLDLVQARLAEVESAENLEEASKTRALDLYRQAQRLLETADAHAKAAAEYRQALDTAPVETRRLREALAALASAPLPVTAADVPPTLSAADTEQRLLVEQATLASLKGEVAELATQLQQTQARPAQLRQQLAEARQALEAASGELQAPDPAGEPAAVSRARRTMLQARQQARKLELERLDQQLLSHPVRLDLLNARRDLTARELARAEEVVAFLQTQVNERRKAEAERAVVAAELAEREAAGKHPAVRALAERNASLSAAIAEVVRQTTAATAALDSAERQIRQLEQYFSGTRQKLEVAGLSAALGKVLRAQRDQLPDVRRFRAAALERDSRQAEIGLAQFGIEEERRSLADLSRAVEVVLQEQVDPALDPEELQDIRGQVRELLQEQSTLLERLHSGQAAYLRTLTYVDFAQQRLVDLAREYGDFLAKHLLWIPSSPPFGAHTIKDTAQALTWALDPLNWFEVVRVGLARILALPVLSFLGLLGAIALVASRRRMQSRLETLAAKVGKVQADRFSHSLEALGLTALLAAPLPLLMLVAGIELERALDAPDFVKGVGRGLILAAPSLFNIRFLILLCGPRGVARAHFDWNERIAVLLRRQLWILMVIGIPAVFVAGAVGRYATDAYAASLGRIAFIIAMLAFAVFLQRILRPKGGLAEVLYQSDPKSLLTRLRYVWYPLAIGTPVALAILAAFGYYYSAGQLAQRMISTLWLVAGAVVVHDLVIRWLTVEHRRLAFQQARERREAAKAARAARDAGAEPEEGQPSIESTLLDLNLVDAQSRKLLRTVIFLSSLVGVWAIWAAVLPALSFLDKVPLWDQTVSVGTEIVIQPITLADFTLALLVAFITTVAARNLPGVLEIALLQRLDLEPGSRHAITTLAQYSIVAIGISVFFGSIGGSWSQIQWLVAAMGVGLGFGLQEIFANFISGLIILFERPVRVGDTVTVGDLTGTVSRIQIRATTITDWDRKEIIVPNKAFITDRVINWTLSDSVTRIKFTVGVAYGSDPAEVLRVILEAVKATPAVMKDPEPRIIFTGFGDSALNFEVFAFANQLADRLPIINETHIRIHDALREHGIEIPFPQRDVHIRTAPNELMPLLRGVAGAAAD